MSEQTHTVPIRTVGDKVLIVLPNDMYIKMDGQKAFEFGQRIVAAGLRTQGKTGNVVIMDVTE